jgi:tRNA(adenine34) deaminase
MIFVMAGLVPAIHVFYVALCIKTWMPGTRFMPGPAGGRTRVPGMTGNMASLSFMATALEDARAAEARGEVPIGCVIVRNGEVIVRAGNRTVADRDPTAHAELIAIRAAAKALGSERLTDCDLYVTLEPCAMCAAAISFARIRRLYFGASDPKGGAVEHGVRFFAAPTCHHRPEVYSGINESECAALLKDFFQARRP